MTPDRIFLAELRGAEAWEYTNSLNTGHSGDITTVHANGAVEAFERIATLVKTSVAGQTLEISAVKHVLHTTIDCVLFIHNRQIKEVFYDATFKKVKIIENGNSSYWVKLYFMNGAIRERGYRKCSA